MLAVRFFLVICAGAVVSLNGSGCTSSRPARSIDADVCVYGGTSAGVIAAVTACQLGKRAILVEPGRHLGGMSSGGLGYTDFGNKAVIGGLALQFYREVGRHYGRDQAWTFEPHVAENVFNELVARHKVPVLFNHRLQAVEKRDARIHAIVLEEAGVDGAGAPLAEPIRRNAATIRARIFIDSSYEGDLMAKAQVRYTVGREPAALYNEPLNGIRQNTPFHQFLVKVDPYVRPGDPSSGLIPLVSGEDPGKPGNGDHRVQAYNFRMCLTRNAENRVRIAAPPGYDEKRFELLGRYLEALVAAGRKPALQMLLKIDMMPGGKTDINNNGPVSTDFIGQNYEYPDGDWPARRRIWKAHQEYICGLLYYLANSPRVPETIRRDMSSWGFCKDEFADTGYWPHQMYIREARRMVGPYVVTQADCEHKRLCDDPVGMGAYNMDSHNCQRIVRNGAVENEGDVQVHPSGPYPISYRAITPRIEECENLLVPVCLSASHIAYGSIRMEPVFMVLGQSAATAACQAIDQGKPVQSIDYVRLRKALLEAGQILSYRQSG